MFIFAAFVFRSVAKLLKGGRNCMKLFWIGKVWGPFPCLKSSCPLRTVLLTFQPAQLADAACRLGGLVYGIYTSMQGSECCRMIYVDIECTITSSVAFNKVLPQKILTIYFVQTYWNWKQWGKYITIVYSILNSSHKGLDVKDWANTFPHLLVHRRVPSRKIRDGSWTIQQKTIVGGRMNMYI